MLVVRFVAFGAEDEIAEAVGDETALVDLQLLQDVRVVAQDEIGAPVDGQAAEFALVVLGRGHELGAPVERDHDQVRRGTYLLDVGPYEVLGIPERCRAFLPRRRTRAER